MPIDSCLLENKLACFAAPTLMHVKCASLFNIKKSEIRNYQECIRYFNEILRPHGLSITILRNKETSLLVYVYCTKTLVEILQNNSIHKFLIGQGYDVSSYSKVLGRLKKRMRGETFPHEIGIFLGYPLEDVIGFMNHQEELYVGYWKVYNDVDNAINLFRKYDQCQMFMKREIQNGRHISEMISQL